MKSMDEQQISQEILDVCRLLHSRNMLAAADGNVSYRISDDRILITPTGKHKAFITADDIAVITLDNRILTGKPSGERLMHLEVYRRCSQAKCVVHAHPPAAIAWSIARPGLVELPSESLSEVILAVGRIPIIPYARPGTQSMGDGLKPVLPSHRVMILASHGALSWGESLMEAYNGMERLEHSAHILLLAHSLGGLNRLPPEEIAALREMRRKLGDRNL
ncbi:MAG: class II aldolase/adducin family protein [Bdellovibrionota bacterium]